MKRLKSHSVTPVTQDGDIMSHAHVISSAPTLFRVHSNASAPLLGGRLPGVEAVLLRPNFVQVTTAIVKKINSSDLEPRCKRKSRIPAKLVEYPSASPPRPIPKFPLTIFWEPGQLLFELDEDIVVKTLSIWNECPRTIYIQCCGLWGITARVGARWRCQPKTRFRLAPGMVCQLTLTAEPRASPVPVALAAVQLAAAHMRDLVVGYFAVPIAVKFLRYKPPYAGEGE